MSLEDLRKQLTAVDAQIVDLIAERQRIAARYRSEGEELATGIVASPGPWNSTAALSTSPEL